MFPRAVVILSLCLAASGSVQAAEQSGYAAQRDQMVAAIEEWTQLTSVETGVKRLDPRVLEALREVPRHLFPFGRAIIAEMTRDGCFPPLVINPVDFRRLYETRKAEREAEADGAVAEA